MVTHLSADTFRIFLLHKLYYKVVFMNVTVLYCAHKGRTSCIKLAFEAKEIENVS